MKVWSLVLILCLITSFALADVTAEIVSIDKDDNGNIRVWSQYKIDGVEVESRYPKIDEKSVYCTRYHSLNFAGMNDTQIKTRILKDVNTHAESLIQKTFIEKDNDKIFKDNLSTVMGSKVTKNSTDIKVDTNNDGVADEIWTVNTNGEKVINPIITP